MTEFGFNISWGVALVCIALGTDGEVKILYLRCRIISFSKAATSKHDKRASGHIS